MRCMAVQPHTHAQLACRCSGDVPTMLLTDMTSVPSSLRQRVLTSRTNWRALAAGVACAQNFFDYLRECVHDEAAFAARLHSYDLTT